MDQDWHPPPPVELKKKPNMFTINIVIYFCWKSFLNKKLNVFLELSFINALYYLQAAELLGSGVTNAAPLYMTTGVYIHTPQIYYGQQQLYYSPWEDCSSYQKLEVPVLTASELEPF